MYYILYILYNMYYIYIIYAYIYAYIYIYIYNVYNIYVYPNIYIYIHQHNCLPGLYRYSEYMPPLPITVSKVFHLQYPLRYATTIST